MSKNNQASPQKVAALAVGSVGAIGLAYWSISNAMAPPPAPPPAPAPTAPSNLQGNVSSPATAAPNQSAQATTPAVERATASTETTLSPEADPFAPLVQPPPQPAPNSTLASSSPTPGGSPSGMSAGPILPTIAPASSGMRPPSNLQVRPMSVPGPLPPTQVAATQPTPAMVLPDLVGTLLGERPSAVFRLDKQLVLVPVGNTIAGWKVVSVEQGEATVKRTGQSLRLVVGSVGLSQMARGSDADAPASPLADSVRPGKALAAGVGPASGVNSGDGAAASAKSAEKPVAVASSHSDAATQAADKDKTAKNQAASYFAQTPRSVEQAARLASPQESRLRPAPLLAAPRPASLDEPHHAFHLAEANTGDFRQRGSAHSASAQPAATLSATTHRIRRYHLRRRRVRAHRHAHHLRRYRLHRHYLHKHHHRHHTLAWRLRHHRHLLRRRTQQG